MDKKTERNLTAEALRELIEYNPETGIFRWKKPRRGVVVGRECGRLTAYGYREIGVDYVLRPAHRLAFLYMTGSWPVNDVDHINQDKSDNRWCNLREATRSQNSSNVRIEKRNGSSGYLGVTWESGRNRWRSQIRVDGVKVNLGRFSKLQDALRAYNLKAREVFGDFATLNPGVDDDSIVDPDSEGVPSSS